MVLVKGYTPGSGWNCSQVRELVLICCWGPVTPFGVCFYFLSIFLNSPDEDFGLGNWGGQLDLGPHMIGWKHVWCPS